MLSEQHLNENLGCVLSSTPGVNSNRDNSYLV